VFAVERLGKGESRGGGGGRAEGGERREPREGRGTLKSRKEAWSRSIHSGMLGCY